MGYRVQGDQNQNQNHNLISLIIRVIFTRLVLVLLITSKIFILTNVVAGYVEDVVVGETNLTTSGTLAMRKWTTSTLYLKRFISR